MCSGDLTCSGDVAGGRRRRAGDGETGDLPDSPGFGRPRDQPEPNRFDILVDVTERGSADPTRRPTLKSVAATAGVSVSTASLVFSGKGPVAAATRERVLAAAADLGYAGPDPLASSLRRGRAGIVAVIVEGRLLHAFHDPYAVSMLDGLASVLDDIPTGMLLIAQALDQADQAVERLAGAAIDGCVFLGCGAAQNPLADHLRSRGVPMVALGPPYGADIVHIDIDDRAAMRELAEHLHAQGHRRVAHVTLPMPGHSLEPTTLAALAGNPYPAVDGRVAGVADVFGADVPVAVAPTTDVEGGMAAAARLMDSLEASGDLATGDGGLPTAILAQSDLLAVGVMRAAQERGLRVPQDVSVTGFDGIPLDWWDGTLTTVVQPGTGKGEAAGHAIRELLDGGQPSGVVLPTHVRVGTSSGPPRA